MAARCRRDKRSWSDAGRVVEKLSLRAAQEDYRSKSLLFNNLNRLNFLFQQPAIAPAASVPCWLRVIHRSLMGNLSPRREEREPRGDFRLKKSCFSCLEIRRTGLFIFHLRIGVVGGCEHRLLVDSSQMKVYDRGGPTGAFWFFPCAFKNTSGS